MSEDKSFSFIGRINDWWDKKMQDPEFKRRVEEDIKDPTKAIPLIDYLREKLKDPQLDPKSKRKLEELVAREERK